MYGRKDNGTGCLLNLTDGGEGRSGFVWPESLRKKCSEAQRGHGVSAATRERIKEALTGNTNGANHKVSEVTRKILRDKSLGNKNARGHSPSSISRLQMSLAKTKYWASRRENLLKENA